MPRTINPIQKARLKNNLLTQKKPDVKQAMLDAGYAKSTARRSTMNKSVKICQEEIVEDIKKKITIEYVLKELDRVAKLAEKSDDFSSVIRAKELLGKWLAMFTDKQEISQTEKEDNQFSISRLAQITGKN